MPRQHVENTKEFSSENGAKRANKHANKRIIYWPPFWNKVYTLGSTVRVNQCVVCLLMSSMSRLYGAGSCRDRFIGVCSKLVNQLSSTIRW